MPDLTHGPVKIGDLLPIHTYIGHKTGSKLFSCLIEIREKGVIKIQHNIVPLRTGFVWKDNSKRGPPDG